LQDTGKKVGLIRIKSFRPFPEKELLSACKNLKEIQVIDRAISPGGNPPLFTEVKAILQDKIKIKSYVLGLGGQDITPKGIKEVIK